MIKICVLENAAKTDNSLITEKDMNRCEWEIKMGFSSTETWSKTILIWYRILESVKWLVQREIMHLKFKQLLVYNIILPHDNAYFYFTENDVLKIKPVKDGNFITLYLYTQHLSYQLIFTCFEAINQNFSNQWKILYEWN